MQSAENTTTDACTAPIVVLAESKPAKMFVKKGQAKIPTINIDEPHLKLNQVLAKLHHKILKKPGKVRVVCHGLVCFPPDTPDGIRMAKELGEKWSDSFYNGRKNRDGTPKHDFKDAGLWVKFFFDTKNQVIKVSVEPVRNQPVEPGKPVEPAKPVASADPSAHGWIQTYHGWVPTPPPPGHEWIQTPHGWFYWMDCFGWVQAPHGSFPDSPQ
jgi:hypothetical protein